MKRTLITILVVLGVSSACLMWADDVEIFEELNIFDLILGIIEHPDPIPQVHWVRLTADPSDPDARVPGERADGRPVFEFDRQTEEPMLAWAYDAGGDHDIAFNGWIKDDWNPQIEFLTSSTVDEVDPRLYVDDHNHHYMIWWEDTVESRIMFSKHTTRGWAPPVPIGNGRRPSVAIWQGDLVIAYERDGAFGQEVVFARSQMDGPFIPQVVSQTTRTRRLDPIVHVREGQMWIDWKEADNVIAYSKHYGGVWKLPMPKAWTDPSWVGELVVRHAIELEVTK